MGRKHSQGGGVYVDCWHIPGGGIDEGESLVDGVIREVKEEVGIVLTKQQLKQIPGKGSGISEKTLKDTGERVLCHMEFNRFEVHMNDVSDNIVLSLDDDLVEVRWFTQEELESVQQIPGGREFFKEMGYMD